VKKKLHNVLKLLLVFLIFTGLQGRVIIRYAECLNKNLKSEISSTKGIHVRAAIIHCKLQCYTQKFQPIAVPPAVALLSFVLIFIVIIRVYVPFREHLVLVNPVPLLPLRAPPVSLF
jgi:hypothetical protein